MDSSKSANALTAYKLQHLNNIQEIVHYKISKGECMENVIRFFQDGGIWMYILLGVSAVALAVTIERLLYYYVLCRVNPKALMTFAYFRTLLALAARWPSRIKSSNSFYAKISTTITKSIA